MVANNPPDENKADIVSVNQDVAIRNNVNIPKDQAFVGNTMKVEPTKVGPAKVEPAADKTRLLKAFLPVVALLLASFFAAWLILFPKVIAIDKKTEAAYPTRARIVTLGDFRPNISFYGEVIASHSVDLRMAVGGEIVELNQSFKVGSAIRQGEVLVKIDPFLFEGAVLDKKQELAQAKAQLAGSSARLAENAVAVKLSQEQLTIAERDLKRAQTLKQKGSITARVLEVRKIVVTQRREDIEKRLVGLEVEKQQFNQYQSAIARAQWQLQKAQRDLRNTSLLAPFDAVVATQNVGIGKQISANDSLGTLYGQNLLEAKFLIPETVYAQLSGTNQLVGQEIEVVWQIDNNNQKYHATIVRVGGDVASDRGGIDVYAKITAPDTRVSLRPGVFITINMRGYTIKNAACVSEQAIYGNDHLFVIEDDRLKKQNIKVLGSDGHNVLITGLTAGSTLAVTQVTGAGDGLLVKPTETFKTMSDSCAKALAS